MQCLMLKLYMWAPLHFKETKTKYFGISHTANGEISCFLEIVPLTTPNIW